MNYLQYDRERPGLLVSVRDADEARLALAGGADLIDVKEPTGGSLGAADPGVIAAVTTAVGGRVPVSIAAGELLDAVSAVDARCIKLACNGVAYVKFGLAGCGAMADWPDRWRDALARYPNSVRPVAVVYADWRVAAAPRPEEVLVQAQAIHCPALLIDTWDKTAGMLFDHWPAAAIARFCECVHQAGLAVAIAGSLDDSNLITAAQCGPELVAVRGAVCDGGRNGRISLPRVRTVRAILDGARGCRQGAAAALPDDRHLSLGRVSVRGCSSVVTTLADVNYVAGQEFP